MGEGRMRRMLDICSGLGGASQAFQEHPDWEVHRIENNLLLKDVPGTTLIDVFEWDYKREIPRGYYDLIWASPPCTEFSQAYAAPGPTARRENRAFSPALGIAKKCLEIIEYFDLPPPRTTTKADRRPILPLGSGSLPGDEQQLQA